VRRTPCLVCAVRTPSFAPCSPHAYSEFQKISDQISDSASSVIRGYPLVIRAYSYGPNLYGFCILLNPIVGRARSARAESPASPSPPAPAAAMLLHPFESLRYLWVIRGYPAYDAYPHGPDFSGIFVCDKIQ
jgi:hypothetical protein